LKDRVMSLNYDIEVEVSGKEHQGKTTLVAYLSKILTEAGAELIVQRADPQIDEKLAMTEAELREKLTGKTIFLREIQTIY
jgi:CO dehydrogenase nickel-insertion accessory protein CooC1